MTGRQTRGAGSGETISYVHNMFYRFINKSIQHEKFARHLKEQVERQEMNDKNHVFITSFDASGERGIFQV